MHLKSKKIKKLLHNQKKNMAIQDRIAGKMNDNRLHIRFATENDIKIEGQRSALNRIRRLNTKKELNQYEHSDSRHIRLKPYFDDSKPLHWFGVVSDLTLPTKKDKVEGSVLIDKLSTPDHKELYDYHAWLNVQDIKILMTDKKQKISIGDYIEGISYVKQYGKNKYGLSATIILNVGIFAGKSEPEKIISNYDRGDDWILELENSTASERAKKVYQETASVEEVEHVAGHVNSSYQPSRYIRFQERIVTDEKVSQESPLPLVSKTATTYTAQVANVYANRIIKDNNYAYEAMLGLADVYNEHGRLITRLANLKYPQQAHGLLKRGQKVKLKAVNGEDIGQILKIQDISLIDGKMQQIPNSHEALVGFLLFRDHKDSDIKTKNGQKSVEAFLEWTRANKLDPSQLNDSTKAWNSLATYTADEVTKFLNISSDYLENLIAQGTLVPISPKAKIKASKFLGTELDKIHQAKTANNELLAKEVIKRFKFFRAKDIASICDITEEKAINLIAQNGYKPVNGFYGHLVLNYVKQEVHDQKSSLISDERKEDLLSQFTTNKVKVRVKKIIPNNNDIPVVEKNREANDVSAKRQSDSTASAIANEKPAFKDKNQQLSLFKETTKASKAAGEPVENNSFNSYLEKYNQHIIFKDSKTANHFNHLANTIKDDKSIPAENSAAKKAALNIDKNTNHIRLEFLCNSGYYYTNQFETAEDATKYFESSLKPNELNRFIKGYSLDDNSEKVVSVRAILEWTIQ